MTARQFAADLGSTGGSPVGDGGLAVANFFAFVTLLKMVAASRHNLQAGRLRSPDVMKSRLEESL